VRSEERIENGRSHGISQSKPPVCGWQQTHSHYDPCHVFAAKWLCFANENEELERFTMMMVVGERPLLDSISAWFKANSTGE